MACTPRAICEALVEAERTAKIAAESRKHWLEAKRVYDPAFAQLQIDEENASFARMKLNNEIKKAAEAPETFNT